MKSLAGERVRMPPETGRIPRICVVGPLPPPFGGMANQCEQLVRLLAQDGVEVELVRTNAAYRPAWLGRVPILRAAGRLVPYVRALWKAAGRAEVIHVLANSGWAWHLFAAPAIWIAAMRGVPVIINYAGGNADQFLARAPAHVLRALRRANVIVTPSAFLHRVFERYGLRAEIIPNVVDLSRFSPIATREFGDAPRLVVTRNLEPIYDIPTAIRAFAQIRDAFPQAWLTVAGSGPERARLEVLAADLGIGGSVAFPGSIDNVDIPGLYASADCMLNPSTVDNMPISILEAFASGVPVVATNAGGIPDMAVHGVSALLVPVGDAAAMAREVLRLLRDRDLADNLRRAGLQEATKYAWPVVRGRWLAAYHQAALHGAKR